MERRDFLNYSLLTTAGLLTGCATTEPRSAKLNNSFPPIAPMDEKLLPRTALSEHRPLPTLPLLKNESATPGIFKGHLTIKKQIVHLGPNVNPELYLYNGVLGGPQIVAYEGDKVEITVYNQLSEPTTIHWHGLVVPADQDGGPEALIAPGEKRIYRFTLPENSAGTYWYHPHPLLLSATQTYRGLAGTFIIKSRRDPLRKLPEQHWFISDMRLNLQGQISDNTMMDWMNGRTGNFLLINGALYPNIRLNGETRVRLWNATNARYLRLAIPGTRFKVVGTDGGLLPHPYFSEEIFITPGERYEFIIDHSGPLNAHLVALPYDRKKMMEPFIPHTLNLAKIHFDGGRAAIPRHLRSTPVLPVLKVRKEIVYQENMPHKEKGHSLTPADLAHMFTINGSVFSLRRVDLISAQNMWEEWRIHNDTDMDHNFHLHGLQFYVLGKEKNGVQIPLPWGQGARKDTVNLKAKETVTLACRQIYPGTRMYHCHILEHEGLGMMGTLRVVATA